MRRTTVLSTVLAGLLLVAACSDETPQAAAPDPAAAESGSAEAAGPTEDTGAPETNGPTEAAGSTQDPSQTATPEVEPAAQSEGGVHLNPDATYVDFDTDRELGIVEQALMRAPGPFAGEAFDAPAVLDAVVASDPSTSREWSEAILTQIHPDYAADAQQVIEFVAVIEGVPEAPVEELRGVEVIGQNHFAIVLDASGSMAEDAGSSSRMAEAKEAIGGFVDELPEGSTVSLRVYGHEGDNTDAGKSESCASSAVVYEGDTDGLGQTLDSVEPVGWTPLALAVRESIKDIPDEASDAIVYVVTDGIETCEGDPVEATKELAGQGVRPIVNVIGFQVGDAETQQLRDMAQAGGGTYTDVDSQADLEAYWREDLQAMMDAWSAWKNESLQTISDQGQVNMEAASESGGGVMDDVTKEWDQATEVISLMEEQDLVDYDTRKGVWRELYDRKKTIWRWGYDNKNENWREAYDQKNSFWRTAYDSGNANWRTYYDELRDSRG